jgi:3-methyladenine DNA glycosylase AlkD
MSDPKARLEAGEVAAALQAELRSVEVRNTASMRQVLRRYSRELRDRSPEFMLELAAILAGDESTRWVGYELIRSHPRAFECMDRKRLEALGQGINSWWTVDAFARTLAGPAWLKGQISDEAILAWARSDDPWWRRAALVSTVALNVRSHGGKGDLPRTLQICRLLVGDQHDMVVKALSWALRELVVHDAAKVQEFLDQYEAELAPRVKREVGNKLRTGLKNPRR